MIIEVLAENIPRLKQNHNLYTFVVVQQVIALVSLEA